MTLTVSVLVPASCSPGETFCVESGGRTFDVTCPIDCVGGQDMIMVDLPLEEEDDDAIEEAPADITVDVRVPAGVYPGDEFLIEALGSEFCVFCPQDAEPGSLITVSVPAASVGGGDDIMEEAATKQEPMADGKLGASRHRKASRELPPGPPTPPGTKSSVRRRLSEAIQKAAAATGSTPAAAEPLSATGSTSPPPPPPELPLGRYFRGQIIEVERSDGSWTRASVEEHDVWGDTYTCRLPDGRMKHFLEVSETRPIRCGAFLAGQRVVARGVMGEVDEFDEESGTYEVRETRSRRLLTYVEEGEVREVRD